MFLFGLVCFLFYMTVLTLLDCQGQPNGDYKSCKGCTVYLTCSNGITYDNRPCPSGLKWDDSIKQCTFAATCP
ncbi:hypothetical protein KUTeg_006392 [Tegillarca granosa]|uniref:Chitin-binding type-2 domain-containing protein n=1 Tax=Tegillarca granosa TaxID=220873 RepID=A0ABQ9FKX7_TEGGR|nr:hypothetical protein KUTeg_006392 [Tegillarca granosa]